MTSSKPSVAIYMGSDSDLPTMAEAARVLARIGVPFEVEVTSAHRSRNGPWSSCERPPIAGYACSWSERVRRRTSRGSWRRTRPPGARRSTRRIRPPGLDALLSTVQMPAGIAVGTLAIGKAGAANAGWLAASILALADPELAAAWRPSAARWRQGRGAQRGGTRKLVDLLAE